VATHNISVARDIQYAAAYSRAQNSEQPLLLDIYSLAAAASGSEPRPTVVFVHGGGFVGGTKKSRLVVGEAERLVRRGFIAVSIEYRLAASSFLPELAAVRDAVQDAKAAVRWLVTNAEEYRIDPHRIAVWGGALALGLQPARRPPPARGSQGREALGMRFSYFADFLRLTNTAPVPVGGCPSSSVPTRSGGGCVCQRLPAPSPPPR
jgi:acetyl esterase/lipase